MKLSVRHTSTTARFCWFTASIHVRMRRIEVAYKCAHMMMVYRKQQAVQLTKGQRPVRSPRNECQECCGVSSCTDAMCKCHIATK